MLRTVLNIILYYIILFKYFFILFKYFFFFKLRRKTVRKRGVSSYRGVCMQKKKNLCPEWDLNCCTPAWRSELLPTGLLGSVNRC